MDLSSDEQRQWERTCSPAITSDVLWKLDAYRAALFLIHVVRGDFAKLRTALPGADTPMQLRDAAGSIGANIGEGYSRWSKKDRARILGYALGSARECFTWYMTSRDVLGDDVVEARLVLVARIRSLLLGLIRNTRE